MIRLKQKRRRAKMLGPYLRIPQVNQMCKILEDQDFDRTDLFPLGSFAFCAHIVFSLLRVCA